LGLPPGSTLIGREGGASKIELGTCPRSLMTISDCSGGGAGLPPLSTHLSLASAHCDTPKEAMTPSSEPRTASGLGAKLTITSLVPPASTLPFIGSMLKPRLLASSPSPSKLNSNGAGLSLASTLLGLRLPTISVAVPGAPALGESASSMTRGSAAAAEPSSGGGSATISCGGACSSAVPVAERVGFLFQKGVLIDSLNLAENVALALRASGRPCTQSAIAKILSEVGLSAQADGGKMPGQLSGGMLRRAALAQILAQGKRVVVLDEPFVGLDPPVADEVGKLIRAVAARARCAFVLVSHMEERARSLAPAQIVTLERARPEDP